MSGEIDMAAPISSVKAAVSLFGEVGPITRRSSSDERVLETETRHHMKLKELHHYKDHLHCAQIAKARAQKDLQRANRTLRQLNNRLETVNQLKKACIKAGEAANIRARVLETQKAQRAHLDLENEREGYKASESQLTTNKQELDNLRQDFHTAVEQKVTVFQKVEEAQRKAQADQERRRELENEVKALRQTLGKLRLRRSIDSIKQELEKVKNELLSEVEESKGKAELLQKEAKASRVATEEAEEKLKAALEEAGTAKKVADDKVYNYSGPVREIRISAEKFELMSKKVEGFKSEADVKVATAMAERESVVTREKEVSQKVVGVVEENEVIEAGIKDAMTRAKMAEAAIRMVEGELGNLKSQVK